MGPDMPVPDDSGDRLTLGFESEAIMNASIQAPWNRWFDALERAAKGDQERFQRLVLRFGEISLVQLLAMDLAAIEWISSWNPRSSLGGCPLDRGRVEASQTVLDRVVSIRTLRGRRSTKMGDLDADRAVVGDSGVPRPFLDIEGLVNGAIHIEQEMTGKAPNVMEDVKTPT